MATSNARKAAAARAAASAGDTETLRAALQEERRGYVARGLDQRVKAVDEQLKALGGETKNDDQGGGARGRGRSRAQSAGDGGQTGGEGKPAGDGGE